MLMPGRQMVPFLTIGAGSAIMEGQSEPSLNYGAGIDFFVRKSTAAVFAFRSIAMDSGTGQRAPRQHQLRVQRRDRRSCSRRPGDATACNRPPASRPRRGSPSSPPGLAGHGRPARAPPPNRRRSPRAAGLDIAIEAARDLGRRRRTGLRRERRTVGRRRRRRALGLPVPLARRRAPRAATRCAMAASSRPTDLGFVFEAPPLPGRVDRQRRPHWRRRISAAGADYCRKHGGRLATMLLIRGAFNERRSRRHHLDRGLRLGDRSPRCSWSSTPAHGEVLRTLRGYAMDYPQPVSGLVVARLPRPAVAEPGRARRRPGRPSRSGSRRSTARPTEPRVPEGEPGVPPRGVRPLRQRVKVAGTVAARRSR